MKRAASSALIGLGLLTSLWHGGSEARAVASSVLPAPAGWSVATNGAACEWKTAAPVKLPAEVTFRVHVPVGGTVVAKAVTGGPAAKPLLQVDFNLTQPNSALINAQSSNGPMVVQMRGRWQSGGTSEYAEDQGGTPSSSLTYGWRFPGVKNLWDESDRCDIGAAYAGLVPFAEKDFFLRLVLAEGQRQIWVDDRLVSEEHITNSGAALFVVQTANGAKVLAAEPGTPPDRNGFVALPLAHYSHGRKAMASADPGKPLDLKSSDGRSIPMLALLTSGGDIDLGESLYRYRMTRDAGPDAPYAGSLWSWPDPFTIDPANLSFRAPYREYQNAWLLAWVDEDANKVPRGVFRFYHDDAGLGAATDFQISKESIRQKLVTKLDQRTADGKTLYLIRVPVNTEAYYTFHDPMQRVVSFLLSKPEALSRSYPDPIYAGFHPAGPASSIHLVGITLEEAPFGYEDKPHQFAHVFERPEQPGYTITVTNRSPRQLDAQVTLTTRSFDGTEEHRAQGKASVAAGASANVELNFDLKQNGWHEVKLTVEAAGAMQQNTLSLLVLPPNTRTYGYAANETRFGLWITGMNGPLRAKQYEPNKRVLVLLRKLGIRRAPVNEPFFKTGTAQQYGFLATSGLSAGVRAGPAYDNREKDAVAWQELVDSHLAAFVAPRADGFPESSYCYGGEWGLGGMDIGYAPWPGYTGDGDRALTPAELAEAKEQDWIMVSIGRTIRAKYPKTKLYLQWGSPLGTISAMKAGFPKDLVDGYGMDVPQFAMLPERPNIDDSLQALWELRAEAKHLGWPNLPINWCEGPFLPTLPGMLTEREQMDNLVRIYVGAMAFGVEQFEDSIQDFDRSDYYGAEHYWSGIFHCRPYLNPKPSAAAVATATAMLCGSDMVGPVDTGCLTTYCLAFQRPKTKETIYALWRVRGTVEATVKIRGPQPAVTDAMGNTRKLSVKDGAIRLSLNSSPLWLTGVEKIEGFAFDAPVYDSAPAKVAQPLSAMTEKNWTYDGKEDAAYARNERAVRRIIDPNLNAQFGADEEGHKDAVAITLAEEPGDRPLANRYGALVAHNPIEIPGKAAALGLWIKGNSSWGRVVFQLRDAKGEIWTSVGTKDAWSCDDTYAWSFVAFEGWRYVRFPLPGNHPYDSSRELKTTWWGSRGGDGIVDLPLKLEKIFVEACNEAPYLGEMKLVRDRSYKLSGLVAEYNSDEDETGAAVARYNHQRPLPTWSGPTVNPIARLSADGVGEAPAIREFTEPPQIKDGRSMVIRFEPKAGLKYNLYLARYDDGRGADLLASDVKDAQPVGGLRPDTALYLFLTSVGADNKESKPSKPFKLITRDHFLQK